jgi:cellulose synthase/poly-beta-1,6-N-acetylglucosamine synthase-like glycosyltransferase
MTVALVVFTVCLVVCFYVYFGYPALLWLLATVREKRVRSGPHLPSVSLIVAMHNEEEVAQQKIDNIRALDYPPELLEALLVSDGSTDGTNDVVLRNEDRTIRLVALERGGKASALNAGAATARGEILVFSDANNFFEPDAVRKIVRSFADPDVGGVCGNKRFRAAGGDTTKSGENLYWRYDKWQKRLESRIGSIFAADGTLYAIRRNCYVPIADPAQADDIAISTRVVLQGKRLVWEDEAVAWEDAPVEGAQEFRRKVRVTNHSVRALLNLGAALFNRGFYSVELISHKLLRHLVPLFLVPLLASNVVLAMSSRFFAAVLAVHLTFYLLAAVGAATRDRPIGRARLLYVPYYFCLVNLAALFGVAGIVAGKRHRAWTPRGT